MTTDSKQPRKYRGSSILRRLKRNEEGSTAIEFAFVAAPFLAFLFMTIEVAFVYGGTVSLEHALEKTSRQIRVGAAFASLDDFKTEVCNHVVLLTNCQSKLVVDVRTLNNFGEAKTTDVFSSYQDGSGNFQPPGAGQGTYQPGQGSAVVLVNAFYKWDIIAQLPIVMNFEEKGKYPISPLANQGDGSRIMSASVAFRNEPFNGAGG